MKGGNFEQGLSVKCRGGTADSVAALQLQGCKFDADLALQFVWSFSSSPDVCVGFLPPSKSMQTGYAKLPLGGKECMNVCAWWPVTDWHRWTCLLVLNEELIEE